MNNLNDIIKSNLCLGCGICNLNPDKSEPFIQLNYSNRKGHIVPHKIDETSVNAKIGFEICPGKGYKIQSLAKNYGFSQKFREELGYYDDIHVVKTNSVEILKRASSSGIMTILVKFLLESGNIDKVIVTKFEYSQKGPRAFAFATNDINEIFDAQGSKYCPVDFSKVIEEIKNNRDNTKYAFIGTPCQIASIRNIQDKVKDLGIKYFIGNFCGGYKSYNNMNGLIKAHNFNPGDVKYFRFRGGGQPGYMYISDGIKTARSPYPDYVKKTGYLKLKRCFLCVDANAELADFACGDAWLPEYLNSEIPHSIVITRTKEATNILNRIKKLNLIDSKNISGEETIKSQLENITSKKYRQKSRVIVYRFFGLAIPDLVEGYKFSESPHTALEFNIFIRHRIKLLFQNLGLYSLLYGRIQPVISKVKNKILDKSK